MRCWRFWVWVAVEGAAERWVTPFGHAMIAGLGLRLIWSGLLGLGVGRTGAAGGHQHDHDDHARDQGGPDHARGPQCGHAHGPSPEEVAQVKGWRDGLALAAGIARVFPVVELAVGLVLAGAALGLLIGSL